MTKSEMHSRLYPEPLPPSNLKKGQLMQMLHMTLESLHTATTAPSVPSYSKRDPFSAWSPDPYLHRVYWVLTNSEGLYLADLNGSKPVWVTSADDIPSTHLFGTHQRAKQVWAHLCASAQMHNEGMAIRPMNFCAHRSSPHLWCAVDD